MKGWQDGYQGEGLRRRNKNLFSRKNTNIFISAKPKGFRNADSYLQKRFVGCDAALRTWAFGWWRISLVEP
jgi:hypothetical protein